MKKNTRRHIAIYVRPEYYEIYDKAKTIFFLKKVGGASSISEWFAMQLKKMVEKEENKGGNLSS